MKETYIQTMRRHNILMRTPKSRASLPLMTSFGEDMTFELYSTQESFNGEGSHRSSGKGANLLDLVFFNCSAGGESAQTNLTS